MSDSTNSTPTVQSLSDLHDIVLPPPPSWWPLATGWYVLFALLLITLIFFGIRQWVSYRRNAYRREALLLLKKSTSNSEVATILRRTALTCFPRSEIAQLQGKDWIQWLEAHAPLSASPSVRESLTCSLYSTTTSTESAKSPEVYEYARSWVRQHRNPAH